ncbi:recombination protein NinB [Bradyrhizobium sp. 2]|uniref:recombination protein NinB n=1 Tax=Bradyrhizobium sp. 2 TaxID=190045 RepID=UPI001FFA1A26
MNARSIGIEDDEARNARHLQRPEADVAAKRKMVALTELATQLKWHGEKLTPDEWKILFMDALTREMRVVPSIDGLGVVSLGRSSSNLSKSEFSDLIELIHQFGANHGVVFGDQSVAEDA